MRTLDASLQAAMNSGIFEPYLKIGFGADNPNNYTADVLKFRLTATDAWVEFPYDQNGKYFYQIFALIRGAIINGTPVTVRSAWFYAHDTIISRGIIKVHGKLFPPHNYLTTPIDQTYSQVIDQALAAGRGGSDGIADYEGTPAWKDYQFYPAGRTTILSPLENVLTILKSKYFIFACENGESGGLPHVLFFAGGRFKPGYPTEDWIVDDPLYTLSNNYISKSLLSRDEYGTIHLDSTERPIHNLGFLPSTAERPVETTSEQVIFCYTGAHTSKIPVHLMRQTGDTARVRMDGITRMLTRCEVEEIFDPSQDPAWHQIIRPLAWLENTEGGTLPSTIEAAAPYTPLNTSNFNTILSSNDNNIQAAMETLDDHSHPFADHGALTGLADDDHDRYNNWGATVYHNSIQTIAHNTWSTLAFNTEVSDPLGWHDTVTNNSRVTVNRTGTYLIFVENMAFANNATGARGVQILVNGSGINTAYPPTNKDGQDTPLICISARTLNSGDYITVNVYQTSGGNLNIQAYCKLSVILLKK